MSNLEKISKQLEKIEDNQQIMISLLMKAYDISNEEYEDICVTIHAAKILIAKGDIKGSDRVSKRIEDVVKKIESKK